MLGQFKTFHAFLLMGGFAPYVWSAYGVVFIVVVLNIFLPIQKKRRIIKMLKQQELQEPQPIKEAEVIYES